MQFEHRSDFSYISSDSDYDLYYAAIIDEQGNEVMITPDMIDQLYARLCAESHVRQALVKSTSP